MRSRRYMFAAAAVWLVHAGRAASKRTEFLRRLIYAAVALFVLAAIAALIVPRFVDWTRYKPDFARQLEAASGRRTAIDGEISLQLLPSPTLRATNVRIANVKGASDAEIARIASLEMRLDFWSLLGGRIVGTSVTLVQPTLSLEILKDGRPNWLLGAGGRSRLIERLTVRGHPRGMRRWPTRSKEGLAL